MKLSLLLPQRVLLLVELLKLKNQTPSLSHGSVQTSWSNLGSLVLSLSEEVLGTVHNISTSREVWNSLAENFNKSSLAREFSLRRSLQLLSKKDKSFSVYCRDFKALCESLSAIGKPIEESMKIFGFPNGLTREYDPIATVI